MVEESATLIFTASVDDVLQTVIAGGGSVGKLIKYEVCEKYREQNMIAKKAKNFLENTSK